MMRPLRPRAPRAQARDLRTLYGEGIHRMRAKGKSIRFIARALGIGVEQVYAVLGGHPQPRILRQLAESRSGRAVPAPRVGAAPRWSSRLLVPRGGSRTRRRRGGPQPRGILRTTAHWIPSDAWPVPSNSIAAKLIDL